MFVDIAVFVDQLKAIASLPSYPDNTYVGAFQIASSISVHINSKKAFVEMMQRLLLSKRRPSDRKLKPDRLGLMTES